MSRVFVSILKLQNVYYKLDLSYYLLLTIVNTNTLLFEYWLQMFSQNSACWLHQIFTLILKPSFVFDRALSSVVVAWIK